MESDKKVNWTGWLIFLVILLVAGEWDERARDERLRESLEMRPVIPPFDIEQGEPLFYSSRDQKWVYNSNSRAKADACQDGPYDDEDFKKQLQRVWPKYRKKTYWGEEWDWDKPDVTWDDEGDDDEQEDQPNR